MNLSNYGLNNIKIKRILSNILIDILALLLGTIVAGLFWKEIDKTEEIFSNVPLFAFFLIMIISAFILQRYELHKRRTYYSMLNRFLITWVFSSAIILAWVYYLRPESYISIRGIVFWLVMIYISEFVLFSISYAVRYARLLKAQREEMHISSVMNVMQHENENPEYSTTDLILHLDIPVQELKISDELYLLENSELRTFIQQHTFIQNNKRLFLCTTNTFNIETSPDLSLTQIINIQKINPIPHLNRFFETVYTKLQKGGIFILCVETLENRRDRLSRKYHVPIKIVIRFIDFMIHQLWPQIPYIRILYFTLWKKSNRRISYTETLGRLYCCGFEYISEIEADGKVWFAMKKTRQAVLDAENIYGPIIKLKRIGIHGKEFSAFKFRTMYPYSEYLQEFIYSRNSLNKEGKFKDDFRITSWGKFLRRYWIDELPMLINFFKGDLKLVGVRPLSRQYYNLYPEELKQLRTQYKPGLIPPYYSDLPKNLDEIFLSEKKYLEAYSMNKLKTNWRYFRKAVFNILFKKARSM